MVARIAELVDVQNYLGQEMENVFHFVDPAGAADLPTLVANYRDDVIPLLKAMQSTALTHTAIKVRQVYPTAELVAETSLSPAVAGTDGNLPADSYMAYSVKWTINPATVHLAGGFTGHIKRGGMRIGGITLSDVGGNAVPAGIVTACNAFVLELLNPGEDAFQLCVASFLIGNHTPGGPPRDRADTVQSYALVTGGSVPGASTQNTRKVLRGRSS
jgi:hypothetical protein